MLTDAEIEAAPKCPGCGFVLATWNGIELCVDPEDIRTARRVDDYIRTQLAKLRPSPWAVPDDGADLDEIFGTVP